MVWWDIGNVFLSSSSSDPNCLTSQSTLPPISLPPNFRIFQQKCLEEKKMCVLWRTGSFLIIRCTFQLKWLHPAVLGFMATESLFPKKWV